MNPLDLPGPQFLVFYAGLSAVTLVGLTVVRRILESAEVPNLGPADPYLIAYLRSGPEEAVRVATVSLLDRSLLTADGQTLQAQPDAILRARRALERSIMGECINGADAGLLAGKPSVREACELLKAELQEKWLLPGPSQARTRAILGWGATAALVGLAVVKMIIAYSRGHHNIGFLVLEALVVFVFIWLAVNPRLTALGKRVLQDYQSLFSRLRERADRVPAGGANNDLSLLAGVFGLTALSGDIRRQSLELFPLPSPGGSDGTSGSSCSSCGSSCGGGGCGGGCGGCGS